MSDELEMTRRFALAEKRARKSRQLSAGFFAAAVIAGMILSWLSYNAKKRIDILESQHLQLERRNHMLAGDNDVLERKRAYLATQIKALEDARRQQEDNLRSLTALQNQHVLGTQKETGGDYLQLETKARADLKTANIRADLDVRKHTGVVVVLGSYRDLSEARKALLQFTGSVSPKVTLYLARNGYYAVALAPENSARSALEQAHKTVADAYLYDGKALPIELHL
jgi:hypothetical protein